MIDIQANNTDGCDERMLNWNVDRLEMRQDPDYLALIKKGEDALESFLE